MPYKHCVAFLLGLLSAACHGQDGKPTASPPNPTGAGEFATATNGLIYSPQTMRQLRHIVDSLNLRHKVCELRRAYRSQRQGQAYYVRLDKDNLKEARLALTQGMSPENFQARFPKAEMAKDLLVISYQEAGRGNASQQVCTEYRSIPFNGRGEHTIQVDGAAQQQAPEQGRWVVEFQRNGYPNPYVEAFYFPAGLTQTALPALYANLVQYADCLIDTTAQIYLESARRTGVRYPTSSPKAQAAFMAYAHQQTHRPEQRYSDKLTDDEQRVQWRQFQVWDSLRLGKMDQLAQTSQFRQLLAQAATSAESMGASDDEFEEYVSRYYSSKKALELKRSRRVVGGCSQDDSPRRHALSIAQLSAETVNWETFLRAHLDIMNDRFERVSDGSYAWAARKTYLRELEVLDINVPDLLLGISLRIDNASRNHYFGSLSRVGRALADTQQPRELEQRLLGIVADPSLDAYNRVLAYYLFRNYNYNLEDQALQKQNTAKLNAAVQKLPAYLVAQATVTDEK